MIITCKGCDASFNLDESLLKPIGSKVRCSKCKEVFVAYPPTPLKEPEETPEVLLGLEDEQETKDLEIGEMDEPELEELDLPGMEELFAEEEALEGEDVTDEALEDFELDLDLDLEADEAPADVEEEAKPEELDELDLSDMEKLLDEEALEDEDVADEAIEDFDLDLEPEAGKVPEDVSSDFEPEEADELDLLAIEKMLDLEEPETEDEAAPEEVELELDMEMEPELEKALEDVEVDVGAEELEGVDLSDIEKMLEVEEETEPEDLELGLDVEEESVDTALSEDTSGIELYEFDEIDDTVDTPEVAEPSATDDMELEFEIEDSEQEDIVEDEIADVQPVEEKDEEVTEAFYMDTKDLDKADEEPAEPVTEIEAEKAAPVVKKRISKPILVLLILALLGGGGYAAYVLLDFMNIKIPFVSDYFKPQVHDPLGNLKIETIDINSKFVRDAKEGKLFVITGRIKNEYSDVRGYVKITGKLYTKGKVISQTETVFCGNVLSEIELSNLDLAAIKKRLSNRLGDNKSNMQIKPGQELPFMIVFSNLPDNLEEFAVEVTGSTQG
ncbi:MAG: hypothetical protein BBJ57_09300 [Desulfobacterales bacterium PC51MH44]|nr:MAG: hypothetical protein BBJ57_09300 [Desulfobacterales bacterium PC51MH44]